MKKFEADRIKRAYRILKLMALNQAKFNDVEQEFYTTINDLTDPEPRPFQRGDRVQVLMDPSVWIEFDVVKINGDTGDLENDGGVFNNVPFSDIDIILITPAEDRDIQAGDTVEYEDEREKLEFVVTGEDAEIWYIAPSGVSYRKSLCTFRYRPKSSPKPAVFTEGSGINMKRVDEAIRELQVEWKAYTEYYHSNLPETGIRSSEVRALVGLLVKKGVL